MELATTDQTAAKEFNLFAGVGLRCHRRQSQKKLGAQLFIPRMPIEDIGGMAVLADPQGAAFAIFEASGQKISLAVSVRSSELRAVSADSRSRAAETAKGERPCPPRCRFLCRIAR